MSAEDSIKMLLMRGAGDGNPLDAAQWRRIAARLAWTRATLARWRAAQEQMDERCSAACERLDAAAFTRLCDAEQAKVDAIRAQLDAVIARDEWPKEMYFRNI